jgi:hypothetical protein
MQQTMRLFVAMHRRISVERGVKTLISKRVRLGRALRGWVQVEAPPDTGRLQPTRKGMNRHRVRVPAPRLTSSSREIQACGFAQHAYWHMLLFGRHGAGAHFFAPNAMDGSRLKVISGD